MKSLEKYLKCSACLAQDWPCVRQEPGWQHVTNDTMRGGLVRFDSLDTTQITGIKRRITTRLQTDYATVHDLNENVLRGASLHCFRANVRSAANKAADMEF